MKRATTLYSFYFKKIRKIILIFFFSPTLLNSSWCCDHQKISRHYIYPIRIKKKRKEILFYVWHILIKHRYLLYMEFVELIYILICLHCSWLFWIDMLMYKCKMSRLLWALRTCKITHVCIVFPVQKADICTTRDHIIFAYCVYWNWNFCKYIQ